MGNKTVTQEDVRKAWSEKVGKVDQYDLHEVETADGEFQTQLIDKDTGSITVAVNGKGDKVLQKLFDHAGDTFIDGGESPLSSTGNGSVKRYTSSGVLATPTQPEVMVGEQEAVEVSNQPGKSKQAQAPVDRLPSTGSVQLTGEGGEKQLKEAKGGQKTERQVAQERGISQTVADEQKKKGGNSTKAEKAAAKKQEAPAPKTDETKTQE